MRIAPYFYLFPAVLLLTLAACKPPDALHSAQGLEQSREKPLSSQGQIVYVGNNGSIYTVRPDGKGSRLVATSIDVPTSAAGRERTRTFHGWPVWSPNGRFIAFSTVSVTGQSSLRVELKAASADGRIFKSIYENVPSSQPFIGPNLPHYVQWSRNSQSLAFMAMTAEGVTLFLRPLESSEDPKNVISGAPLYIAWSPDSTQLLVHAQERLIIADAKSLLTTPLSDSATAFRVPSWSWDGQKLAFLETKDGAISLFAADKSGKDKRLVLSSQTGGAAFLWSPASDTLAIAVQESPGSPFYSRLEIHKSQAAATVSVAQGQILAFFWAPDGKKLAYVALEPSRRVLNWWVVNGDGSGRRMLSEFTPSPDLLTLFAFFDQYASSNSFWSPDSRYLVFAGRLTKPEGSVSPSREGGLQELVSLRAPGNGGRPQLMEQTPLSKVYIIDVQGKEAAREIAEGTLAFWSPN